MGAAAIRHGFRGITDTGNATQIKPLTEQMVRPPSANQGLFVSGSDGGVFALGAAGFHGSMGGAQLSAPVVGVASTPDGGGYWLVGSDGGVFAFGDAHFYGSMGGTHLNAPIVSMAATPDGGGYWLVGADGGVFSFGDAHFYGSMGGTHLNAPIVSMAATPTAGATGWWAPTVVCSPSVTPPLPDLSELSTSTPHRVDGRHPRRRGLLDGGLRRWCVRLR